MRAATRQLRDLLQAQPELRSGFTPKQLRSIQAGDKTIPGFTWHHHQDVGRMQLLPRGTEGKGLWHSKVGHIGGDKMWKGK